MTSRILGRLIVAGAILVVPLIAHAQEATLSGTVTNSTVELLSYPTAVGDALQRCVDNGRLAIESNSGETTSASSRSVAIRPIVSSS